METTTKNFKNDIEDLQTNQIKFIEMKNTIKLNLMDRLNSRTAEQRSIKIEDRIPYLE